MSLKRFRKRLSKRMSDIVQSPPPEPAPKPLIMSQQAPSDGDPPGRHAHRMPQPSWPLTIQVLPQEGIQALVHHHTILTPVSGLIHCWTYISQGLIKAGQKEIVFTIRRRVESEGEHEFPQEPIQWYEMVYSAAKQGLIVDEFQRTEFRAPSFLGRPDIPWIVYAAKCPIDNVTGSFFPPEWLQAIPLLAPEAEVASSYGVMRALSHLGYSQRWFPWPAWFDRDRKPCIEPSQMQGSIRAQVSHAMIPGLSAVKKGQDIVLYIPERAEDGIKQALDTFSPDAALPLDCVAHRDADSGLLWCNTDTEPRGYAAGTANSCLNLNSITFCPCQEEDSLKLFEDGYIVMLKSETWMHIRQQLRELKPVFVDFPSGERLLVDYGRLDNMYPGMQRYAPQRPRPPSSKPWHVHCDHIVLLDNNASAPEEAVAIADHVKAIEKVVDATVPRIAPPDIQGGGRLIIEADVGGPDRADKLSRTWISIHFSPPELEKLPLAEIHEKLTALEGPNIEPRTRYQLMFNVWGYSSSGN